jgi:hypothetical protein
MKFSEHHASYQRGERTERAEAEPPPRARSADRWFVTEVGVRDLAVQAGIDPEAAVAAWRDEWEMWLSAEAEWQAGQAKPEGPIARSARRKRKREEMRLNVLSGQTMLTEDDAENLRYTTAEGA